MGIFHVQFLRYNEETKLVEPMNRVALEGGFCRRLGPAEMVARKSSLEIGEVCRFDVWCIELSIVTTIEKNLLFGSIAPLFPVGSLPVSSLS